MVAAPDYVALQARLQPSRRAACNLATGDSWSYAAFDDAIARYAATLCAYGVAAGDRVAAIAKNRAELVLLHLACARIGAIYVPLNWRLAGAERDALIADCAPRLIVGDAALYPAAMPIAGFADRARDAAPRQGGARDADRPSLILYTSGTSGRPKGVLLSERNIEEQARNFALLGHVGAGSVVLCDAPMFHTIGLVANIRPALMHGGTLLISDGFVPARTLARLADPELAVTHYFCVPQMAAMLRAEPSYDPAKLRGLVAMFSGGAPHAAAAIRDWLNDGIPIADGFGMSETGTVSCMPLAPGAIDAHAGAAGLIPPSIGARILDETGADCPAGATGELVLKGPNVTSGYWRRPAETLAAFTSDGWLYTGDLARVDGDGFLWLVDRKKDMFISGGENVYPAEIEGALAGFPALVECAVIGVPDSRWGEVGHLVLAPLADHPIDRAEIIAYLETRLARYKIPKHVTIMDALPRNGAGKLLKSTLHRLLVSTDCEQDGAI